MRLFNRKNKEKAETVQTAVSSIYSTGLAGLGSTGQTAAERQLFRRLREEVPVVDAAINKLVRLLGTFTVECDDPSAGEELSEFLENVRVVGEKVRLSRDVANMTMVHDRHTKVNSGFTITAVSCRNCGGIDQ